MSPSEARPPSRPGSSQAGLTMVELLISIAVGLLVMVAFGYLYMGSRQSFRVQDSVARIQENGRYALEVMGQDLRVTGFVGCGSLTSVTPALTANPNPDAGGGPIASLTPATVLTGTQGPVTLTVYKTTGSGEFLTAAMASPAAAVPIPASARNFAVGSMFLIANCTNADVFRNSVAIADGTTDIQHAAANNDSGNLSVAYGPDAMVYPFEAIEYHLGNNPAGNSSLYRRLNGTDQEVVENVEDLQITYGEDTDADGAVNAYVTANNVADWSRVLAVRVSLLLVSPENNVATQAQTYVWDTDNDGALDDAVTANDRRLRYVFTSTIGLRNRLR
ncbi:MAG: PilW family protein [Thiobacillaceae bacterium]|nr:PilW family protein [Thiobacillaceae bacterium]